MENNCIAKFTVNCMGKKFDCLKIKGNHEVFADGLEMESILNLDYNLEFELEVLDKEGNIVESELETNQKHKIQLTENSMDLQWTYGIDYVENEIDWDKIIDEQEKAFNEAKDESEKLLKELQERNEEQAKQMETLAESMKQQQDMINEINGSITDYTTKVNELAEKNKQQMEEFEKQKQEYLDEMKKLEEEQKIALENLKIDEGKEQEQQQE